LAATGIPKKLWPAGILLIMGIIGPPRPVAVLAIAPAELAPEDAYSDKISRIFIAKSPFVFFVHV